jgi:hypothetical protein
MRGAKKMGRLDPGAPRYLGNRIALLSGDPGCFPVALLGCYLCRHNRHVGSAIAFGRERNLAMTEGEERVVAAEADVLARMEFGAALTHEDLAATNGLAAKTFHAKAPTGRVTTVARRAACFLVSHNALLFPNCF